MIKKKKLLQYGVSLFLVVIIGLFVFLGLYADRVLDPYVSSLLEDTKPIKK